MSLGLGSSLGRLGAWAAGGWMVVESGEGEGEGSSEMTVSGVGGGWIKEE